MCTFSQEIKSPVVVTSIWMNLRYLSEKSKEEPYKLEFDPSTFIPDFIPLPGLPLILIAMDYKCIDKIVLHMNVRSQLAFLNTCQTLYRYFSRKSSMIIIPALFKIC
jgi:hypothetical protein